MDIKLKDGSLLSLEGPMTAYEAATHISEGLARAAQALLDGHGDRRRLLA